MFSRTSQNIHPIAVDPQREDLKPEVERLKQAWINFKVKKDAEPPQNQEANQEANQDIVIVDQDIHLNHK